MQTETPKQILRDPRDLKPHRDNPRGVIDPESEEITRLADDILKNGVIQPIVVNSKNEVLAGHRRRVAAIRAGLPEVPVVYRELTGSQFIEEIFLSENMQRQDLSPLEEARAIDAVAKKWEKQSKKTVTVADLSRRLHIPKGTVTSRLAILKLPTRIQHFFHIWEIPVNSATQLIRLLEWPDEVEKFADRLVTRQIAAKSLDALITRRMHDLQRQDDNQKTIDRQPKLERIQKQYVTNHHTPVVTRETVLDSLSKRRGSISLHNLQVVLDSTCCSCGMIGNQSVCLSCPLPKFINGVLGRADAEDRNEF